MNNLNNGLSEFSGNNVIDDLTHINSSKDLPHKENDEKELDDRNKIYSTILENYSKYLKDTLNSDYFTFFNHLIHNISTSSR